MKLYYITAIAVLLGLVGCKPYSSQVPHDVAIEAYQQCDRRAGWDWVRWYRNDTEYHVRVRCNDESIIESSFILEVK